MYLVVDILFLVLYLVYDVNTTYKFYYLVTWGNNGVLMGAKSLIYMRLPMKLLRLLLLLAPYNRNRSHR